ncbi:hypothetical protein ACFZC6_01635 [Streptomyces ossamyceticus]|uniref:hypothetical protein n=1 Tax=Streptomyces ossamyceticus TaxID=249581 RepID=UPI0036DFD3E5
MSKKTTTPRPAQAGPLGHGYCWEQHPVHGVHCTQPAGHEAKGVEHLHPYVNPPLRWS